jgi:carboxypeptidase family protein
MKSRLLDRKNRRLLLFGLIVALIAGNLIVPLSPVLAQSAAGTIAGQITDQQRAAIAGAEVKLVDTTTNSTRATVSNDVGRYTFPNVPPGNYDLTVTKAGFSAARLAGQNVEVGEALTLDVAMQIGATTTTVEVQAAAGAELQTLNSTVGSTITNDSLNLLPNLGRDASTLSVLQVGVAPTGNVGGAGTDQNSFQLDGGFNTDDMSGDNATYVPGNGFIGSAASGGTPSGVIPTPIESIEEIKIGSSNQTADFNGAAGSQVQMVTKRGTSQFHGALYEFYFGNDVGAANLWKNNHTPDASLGLGYTPLPATHRNRFGGALGGPLTPRFWGGKTFFFVNYEGMRYPNVATFERAVPTALLRAGIVTLPNSAGVETAYNLNPVGVTVNGVNYAPAQCTFSGSSGLCDPRGLGLNPLVSQIWSKLPLPNDPQYIVSGASDGINEQGYLGQLALPQTSNFFVARIDHDFGDKWKFMSSYRYYSFTQATSSQTTLSPTGQYSATAPRPQKPDFLVGGLTTTITSSITNDFRASYLRNFWQWSTLGGQPQLPGLGGALEMGGESAGTNALIPTNVNTQSTRQRLWDGHDQFYSDNLSVLHGNHLLQFGGSYLRNFDYFVRNDNGASIDSYTVYQLSNGTGIGPSGYPTPTGLASSQATTYDQLYSEVMGIVGLSQVLYTRNGPNLTLNPTGVPAYAHTLIPTYDTYFSDTWHVKPTLTLTYGLAWSISMPPYESQGHQVLIVDSAGQPLSTATFLAQREAAALSGLAYAPEIGFATTPNSGNGNKYPFPPFYGGFSPRVSVAWNPNAKGGWLGKILGQNETVIRGGYARIYGRLNGVEQVLAPLTSPGITQAVSCNAAMNGTCAAAGSLTAANAFRIGADGLAAPLPAVTTNLSQPYFAGVNGNAPASDGSSTDPGYRPDHSDEFNFTIQRSFGRKALVEVGYIGKRMRDLFQGVNIDPVPTMMTLNGQSFAQAYSDVFTEYCGLSSPNCAGNTSAVTAQPFFEAALGGSKSPFCSAYSSCTAAVLANYGSTIKATQVYTLWQNLSQANGWTLGRTLLSSPALGTNINAQLTATDMRTSLGYGNYNAAFVRFTTKDWHGLTASSNFTWSRSLGTASLASSGSAATVVDPFNLAVGYGPTAFDYKVVYSLLMLYQVPFFKSQQGILGHILGGWSIAPVFTAQSGAPLEISVDTGSNQNAQAYGEVYGNSNVGYYENAIPIAPFTGGNSLHEGVAPSGGVATSGTSGLNLFPNPAAVYAEFRPPVLGTDFNENGAGPIRGFPNWNVDATVSKSVKLWERVNATLMFQFVNLLNHFQPANPSMDINSPQTWGVVTAQATSANGVQSRWMEFGLRIGF